ncbi:MAG: hypothetical protein ACLT98_14500 [Eggerthellaceae bacterium]
MALDQHHRRGGRRGGVLVLSMAFDKVTRRWSLGGGDVKLLFMVGLFLRLVGFYAESADGVPYGVGVRVCSGVFRTFFAGRGRRRGKRPNKGDSVRAGHCRGHGVHAVGGADHPPWYAGCSTGYAAG